jgi:hypothetical protein
MSLDAIGMRGRQAASAAIRGCSDGAATVCTAARKFAYAVPFIVALLGSLALHALTLAGAEHAYAPYRLGAVALNSDAAPTNRQR